MTCSNWKYIRISLGLHCTSLCWCIVTASIARDFLFLPRSICIHVCSLLHSLLCQQGVGIMLLLGQGSTSGSPRCTGPKQSGQFGLVKSIIQLHRCQLKQTAHHPALRCKWLGKFIYWQTQNYSTPIANEVYSQNLQTFSCLKWTITTKAIILASTFLSSRPAGSRCCGISNSTSSRLHVSDSIQNVVLSHVSSNLLGFTVFSASFIFLYACGLMEG